MKRIFVCVTIKRDPQTEGVLRGQKVPRKEGWFSVILIERHKFVQFDVAKLILKARNNKFAHVFSTE